MVFGICVVFGSFCVLVGYLGRFLVGFFVGCVVWVSGILVVGCADFGCFWFGVVGGFVCGGFGLGCQACVGGFPDWFRLVWVGVTQILCGTACFWTLLGFWVVLGSSVGWYCSVLVRWVAIGLRLVVIWIGSWLVSLRVGLVSSWVYDGWLC